MNIIPMLLASCLHNDKHSKRMKTVQCTALICLFVILFSSTFTLRFTSQELLFSSESEFDIPIPTTDISGKTITEEDFKPTAAQNMIAIILGLEPLGTSILSFILAYGVCPKNKVRQVKDLQKIELDEEINILTVMIDELQADMEFDLDEYDKTQYEEYIAILVQLGELAKNTSLRKLCEHEGTPEALSYLMEGEYQQQKKEKETANTTPVSEFPVNESTLLELKSIA